MAPVTRLEVTKIRLLELVRQVQRGRIRVPSFHRPFRWDAENVERLFDSILRGYPIGTLLVWERPVETELVLIGGLRINAPADAHGWSLVDGHQRLSAIVGALTARGDTVDSRLIVCYDLTDDRVVALPARKPPSAHQLPLDVAADNRRLLQWQRERPWFAQQEFDHCDEIAGQLVRYEIPLGVIRGGDTESVADIFARLNTQSLQLTSAELSHARVTAKTPGSRAENVTDRDVGQMLGFGSIPAQVLADCEHLRSGSDAGHRLPRDAESEPVHRGTLEDDVAASISFLRDSADIPHFRLLPHASVLPVLVWYMSRFEYPSGRESELLRRWVWRALTLPAFDHRDMFVAKTVAGFVSEPIFSVVRLLDSLPRRSADYQWEPPLYETSMNRPHGRLNVLAMLCLDPTLLAPWASARDQTRPVGARVRSRSVIGALLDEGMPVLQRIVPGAEGGDLGDSLANRIVHPPLEKGSPRSVLLGGDLPAEVLRAHGLTPGLVESLRTGDVSGFLANRRALLGSLLAQQVQRRALWGFDNFGGPTTLIPPGGSDEPDLDFPADSE